MGSTVNGNVRPLTQPAIAVRRPEASPPSPIDTESELQIAPGTKSFPVASKAKKAAPTASFAMAAPSTPVAAAAKKRKRSAAVALVSPGSPRTVSGRVPLERPPLSPNRAFGSVSRRTVRAKSDGSRPLRQHDVLFDHPPWTDARAECPPAPLSPPSQPHFPTVPDLFPMSRRPASGGHVSSPASEGAILLSPSRRDVEGGSARRAGDLLRMLALPRMEGDDQNMTVEDGEEEEDLVGLKFVSFDEGENEGSRSPFS